MDDAAWLRERLAAADGAAVALRTLAVAGVDEAGEPVCEARRRLEAGWRRRAADMRKAQRPRPQRACARQAWHAETLTVAELRSASAAVCDVLRASHPVGAYVGIATGTDAAFAVAVQAYAGRRPRDPRQSAGRRRRSAKRPRGVGAGLDGCRCLDAGCVFVPLEPRQPRFRLRALLDAVPLAAVLAAPQHEAAVVANGGLAVDRAVDVPGGLRYLRLVAAPEAPLPARHPDLPGPFAYVVFTSGSTGTPKPVFAPLASIASNVRSLVYGAPVGGCGWNAARRPLTPA